MPARKTSSPVHSSRLPEGVAVQPRRFEFEDLDQLPAYWLGENPLLTHAENTFSLIIPPGERFFIDSVKHYESRIQDPELRALVRGFVQQEALHMRAHHEFNRTLEKLGVDVDAENAAAERAIARLRRLPRKLQLGVTVFLEHLTATGAALLFSEPAAAEAMHPQALRFWRWHAVEELEHKAVAFDVFRAVGGGYLLRMLSVAAALALLAGPCVRMFKRLMRADGVQVTAEMRAQARALQRQLARPHTRLIATYFRPGFHPWQLDDAPHLAEWYASPEAASAR